MVKKELQDTANYHIVKVQSLIENEETKLEFSVDPYDTWDKCLETLKKIVTEGKVDSVLVFQGRILPIKDDLSKISLDGTEVSLKPDSSTYIPGFVAVKENE